MAAGALGRDWRVMAAHKAGPGTQEHRLASAAREGGHLHTKHTDERTVCLITI